MSATEAEIITRRWETITTGIVEPHVLVITLNRPAVGNALNTRMGQELDALWTGLTEEAGDIRCIVLTGAGDRVFCAGGDLKERNGMSRQQWVASTNCSSGCTGP